MPLGLITTRLVAGSRALTLPPAHLTSPFLGSSRCSLHTCSMSCSSKSLPRFLIAILLPQRIHGGSFDDESLFVALHERCKSVHIRRIGRDRRALFSCKDLVGEIGFQRL